MSLQNCVIEDGREWYKFGQKKGSVLARAIPIRMIMGEKLSEDIGDFSFSVANYKYVNWTHYFSKKDMDKIVTKYSKLLDDEDVSLDFVIEKPCTVVQKAVDDLHQVIISRETTPQELVQYFDKLVHYIGNLEVYQMAAAFIIRVLSWKLEKALQEICPQDTEKEIKEKISILAYDERDSVPLQMNRDLLELAVLYKKHDITDMMIQDFVERYDWSQMMFLVYDPLTSGSVRHELEMVKDPEKELEKLDSAKKQNIKRKIELQKELSVGEKINNKVNMLILAQYNESKEIEQFQHLHYYFYPVLLEIAIRFGLTYNELIYCFEDEIRDGLLLGKSLPTKDEIQKRRVYGCTIYISDGIFGVDKTIYQPQKTAYDTIKGFCASKGRAYGTVKIVFDAIDLQKVNEGDILVTGMTLPNFLVAMRKAAAIVTNDGGVTCHAAIVSRELGKPCVIGTKIATEVLEDGDVVEVDADNAIVKKIVLT